MARRPAELIYGLEDRPPWLVLLALAVQHAFLMSSTLVLPVVLVSEIGGSFREVRSVVGLTMIACGIGTILQALRFRGVGSGYLCPNLCGPNFFSASMNAAWLGGLPLVRGMTIVAGVAEAVFARLVGRLRVLFPPEITGLVVLMVAESLIPLAASKCLGVRYEGEPISGSCLLVAVITLLTMVGVTVWGRGKLKLYSVLAGMVCGYTLSLAMGLITISQFHAVASAPWLALPFVEGVFRVSFRWSQVPTFLIVSITGALKSFGNLIMAEKINDEEWREPDIKRIGDGLMADSICVATSGLLGGMASDTSASNVALANASGASSRWIAYAAGALFILLGFLPKIAAGLSVMPEPVMGAILIYVTCFMILSGMQIILGSRVDSRKTFVIGISFVFGLSLDILPTLYATVPSWCRPFIESPLTLSTVLAVALNQLLRIGQSESSPRPGGPVSAPIH